jgi:hypothetical protein
MVEPIKFMGMEGLTVDEGELNGCWHSLEKCEGSPGPVVIDVHSSPRNQSNN